MKRKIKLKAVAYFPPYILPPWELHLPALCFLQRTYSVISSHLSGGFLCIYLYACETAGSRKKDPTLLCCAEQSYTESVHPTQGQWNTGPCEMPWGNTQISKTVPELWRQGI